MHEMWKKMCKGTSSRFPVERRNLYTLNFEGNFTYESRKKNVNNVNNHKILDTEILHPSDQPAVNNHV